MSIKKRKNRKVAPQCRGNSQNRVRCHRRTWDSSGFCHDHRYRRYNREEVKKIIDGDTFKTKDRVIRLTKIDTPEKGELGYEKAKDDLETCMPVGSKVDTEDKAIDIYGRTVADVKKEGKDVSELMKKKGWKEFQKKQKDLEKRNNKDKKDKAE